jgi:small subunit ribosomal protein S19
MMIKKAFTFRGKSLEELKELSMNELAELLPCNARRRIKRFTDDEKKLLEKIKKSKKPVKTHLRTLVVLPFMVGKNIKVYNGKEFVDVVVIEEMIGHKLGEFSLTRRKVGHNAPGVGATRSSSNVSVK